MPNITQYGMTSVEQLMATRLQNAANSDERWDVFREFAQIHDQLVADMDSLLAERTTAISERVRLPASGRSLQPLDDKGVPYPVQIGAAYDAGYPIRGGGTAWATNRVTRELMTPAELAAFMIDATNADNLWRRTHMLAALFANASYQFENVMAPSEPTVTVVPLANGDGTTYVRANGTIGTDTHFLAQAAAIDNANNPFPIIRDDLAEHAVNAVSPVNPIITFIPTNLRVATENLTSFVELDTAFIQPGVNEARVVGVTDESVPGPGTVIGVVGEQIIKVFDLLPSNYIVSVATGGPRVLRMRQYPVASLQGFIPERHSPDGNREDYRYIRYAGWGVYNRVGAVVYQIGAGSYSVPTEFVNVP